MANVFKLMPSPQGWTYTDLHDFTGLDGSNPISTVLIDTNGNLYGTTSGGGTSGSGCSNSNGCGVVWEITQ
jgi:hypothetical protein